MNEQEANESVDALIDDLKFIMGSRPHTDWPSLAKQAIAYHDPRIEDRLLDWQHRRLQRAAHLALFGLAEGDAERIRAGVLDVRTIESLADAPPPSAPEPPAVPSDATTSSPDKPQLPIADPSRTQEVRRESILFPNPR